MASTSRGKRSSTVRDHPPSEKRPKVEGTFSKNLREPEISEDEDDSGLQDMSQMSTQAEREGDKASGLSREAEVGVIEKIELTDFMCHRRLDVPLSPNVNFILGRNGSGKSAIMAGIMVALGGKATSTSRGSSLKQFIRTGAKSAMVEVTLRNRGSEAYQPDKYGEKIIVERTIRADGTGSYKLKGSRKNTVSIKKEDLVTVLDHYNIQIDNPVSLLSQDTSRNFLHSSNPNAKYKLFMRATHLEHIAKDYEKTTEEQKLTEEGIRKKGNLLPEYEREAKELEERVQTFERLREMEVKVEELQEELQWALVIEIENTIPPIELDIEKQNERIPRNEAKMKKVEENLAKAEEDLRQISDELEAMTVEAEETGQKRKEMYLQKRAKDKAVRDEQNHLSSVKRKIANKTREMKALEQARDDCIEMSQRDRHGEQEARVRQLEQHRESVRKVESELETAANDRQQFEHAIGHSMDTIRDNKNRMDAVYTKIKASEEHIHQLQSSRNDQLQVFGPWMRSLVDAIARNKHRFRKLPKGPIGSLIGLRDYRWAQSIEAVLGRRLLNSFITDNQYDDQTLKKLMKEVITNPRVFKPDTIQNRFELPQAPYPTVFNMLDVADPDVLNTLIDQAQVETVLLIERRQEAAHVMENVRPPKAKKAYTIEGDEVSYGKHYSNKMPRLNVIRESVDDAIREEKALCDRLKMDMDRLRAEDNRLKQEISANKRHLSEVKSRMWAKQEERNKLKGAILELENAEEEEEAQEDLATYESEILECQEQVQVLETEKEECEVKLQHITAEQSECAKKVDLVEAEVENVAGKMEDLKRRAAIPEQSKKTASSHLRHFQSRLKDIRDAIADLEKKATETRQRALEAAEVASEVCERIETNRTQRSISTEIEKLKRRIRQEEPRLEEREEIQQKYIEAMDRYDKTQEQIRIQKHTLKELQMGLQSRITRYQVLKDRIVERASLYFTHFLQQRDYDGKLKFNHNQEKLDIQVLIDTHSQASQATKNTRSLSGGERSFTTVCFVMALWEAIEAPFRCLDEFDVFMDLFNRRISMRLMLEHAEDQPRRQFIFFTPQDMSSMGVKSSHNVKVFRLQEPERGQTTLD